MFCTSALLIVQICALSNIIYSGTSSHITISRFLKQLFMTIFISAQYYKLQGPG
jgi:hypothetical protein